MSWIYKLRFWKVFNPLIFGLREKKKTDRDPGHLQTLSIIVAYSSGRRVACFWWPKVRSSWRRSSCANWSGGSSRTSSCQIRACYWRDQEISSTSKYYVQVGGWAWELVPSKVVGGFVKIQGRGGRFPGNTVNRNQPFKQSPTIFVTLKELLWKILSKTIPTVAQFQWGVERAGCWIGEIGDQSNDPQRSTEQVNSKYGDQSYLQWTFVITSMAK